MGKKLTEADIDRVIVSSVMHRMTDRTTVCVLTLANGFEVLGQSACVDPAEYNQKDGEHWAYQSARGKIWELEGYRLREALYAADGVPGAVRGEKLVCTQTDTAKLNDVPLMLHQLANDIESGAEPLHRVLVIGHSGAVNAGVHIYGFGEDVTAARSEMMDMARQWFADRDRIGANSKG